MRKQEGWWHRGGLFILLAGYRVVGGGVDGGWGGRGGMEDENIPRPVLTASRPSQTIAQIGPLPMSVFC